jgi:hypothetical protein
LARKVGCEVDPIIRKMTRIRYDRIVGASDMQRILKGFVSSALAATVNMLNHTMAAIAQPLCMPPMWKILAQ